MLEINKSPVLVSSIDIFNSVEIKDIVVVRGYKKEIISGPNFRTIDNDDYAKTKDIYSLYLAKEYLKDNCIISYGDCLYKKHLINNLLDQEGEIKIVVDADLKMKAKPQDLVRCSKPYTNDFFNVNIQLVDFVNSFDSADGEWTGLLLTESKGTKILRTTLEKLAGRLDFKQLSIPALLGELVKKTKVSVVYTKGGWLDIDDITDYLEAGGF